MSVREILAMLAMVARGTAESLDCLSDGAPLWSRNIFTWTFKDE